MNNCTTDWQKLFTIHTADKASRAEEIISYKLSVKRQLSKKWAKGLNKNFTKECIRMTDKDIKKGSTALVNRK